MCSGAVKGVFTCLMFTNITDGKKITKQAYIFNSDWFRTNNFHLT